MEVLRAYAARIDAADRRAFAQAVGRMESSGAVAFLDQEAQVLQESGDRHARVILEPYLGSMSYQHSRFLVWGKVFSYAACIGDTTQWKAI